MKKIVCLFVLLALCSSSMVGCKLLDPFLKELPGESNSSSQADNSNISTPIYTPNSSPNGSSNSYSDKIAEIENKYAILEIELNTNITNCQSKIASLKIEKQNALNQLDNQIRQLEKKRDEEYSKAIANSGGYGSSYANSIKKSYDDQINALKNQKTSITNQYDSQISSQESLLKKYNDEKQNLYYKKQSELNGINGD